MKLRDKKLNRLHALLKFLHWDIFNRNIFNIYPLCIEYSYYLLIFIIVVIID